MPRIAANIVTYNRLGFLKEIIEALRNQTKKLDAIIVVNNSSTDGTKDWLESQNDLIVINQENLGSSGGQYTGFKTAYDMGFDWIWTMDDDVVPKPDCLELLLDGFDENTIRTPLRLTVDGKPFMNDAISYNLKNPLRSIWNDVYSQKNLVDEITDAIGITFEGPLIHRSVIEKIGLPEKKFFIYGDDTEYFIRAWKAGFRIIVKRDALLQRKLEFTGDSSLFNWKTYYFVRNIIAIDVLHGNFLVRWLRPWGYLLTWLFRTGKLSDLRTVIKGFIDSYFYKSGN